MTPKQSTLVSLTTNTTSSLTFLRSCIAALSVSTPPPTIRVPDDPDPIDVLHSASTLLKAHTTKLSLLCITAPFTPSEIAKIVREVSSTCLPAMMSAVELCRPEKFGKLLSEEVTIRVRRVFVGLECMLEELLAQTAVQAGRASAKKTVGNEKDNLTSTGVVWQACEQVMELKTAGTVALVMKKALEYREMLQDAIAELKEWSEGSNDEEDSEEEDKQDEVEGSDGGNSIEELLYATDSLPKNRPDLKATLIASLKKLKLVSTLYAALMKRRLKTVQMSPWNAAKVDHIMEILKLIPEQTDELASAFYNLDDEEARKLTNAICEGAKDCAKMMSIDWKSSNDEFTTWSGKWLEALDNVDKV